MLLSLLIWLPIIGGCSNLLLSERYAAGARYLSLLTVLLSVAISAYLYHGFDLNNGGMQFVEIHTWIPSLMLTYHLGIDGLSLSLILLTVYINLIVILATWSSITHHVRQYFALFLLMQGLMTGIFSACDAILFYMFWEGVLIPMYLVIGLWGGARKAYAAIKFFLYTFLGSVLLLIALIYLAHQAHDFDITHLYHLNLSWPEQCMIFIACFIAFAVKIPMWPLHTWLPDAHTEAPAGGSAILAALMLKAGAYGFLRFMMPILPLACARLSGIMIALSLIAIVYIGLVALAQRDIKRLIAYSSIAHMGFVSLGFFAIYTMTLPKEHATALLALQGASVQMIAHGFSSAALFLGFGMLYERYHTRSISDFGGVANTMPVLAACFLFFIMSSIGLPGTAGFVGECMVLISSVAVSFWVMVVAALTLIIGAVYSLYLFKQVFYGPINNEHVAALVDIGSLDRLVFILLILPVLWFGLYPESLLQLVRPSLEQLLTIAVH